jgi:hypothetical protein
MRVGDVVYFSPRFRFSGFNIDDSGKLLDALRDRLHGLLP